MPSALDFADAMHCGRKFRSQSGQQAVLREFVLPKQHICEQRQTGGPLGIAVGTGLEPDIEDSLDQGLVFGQGGEQPHAATPSLTVVVVTVVGVGRDGKTPPSEPKRTPSASSTSTARDRWETIASGTAAELPSHLEMDRRFSRAR